MKAQDQHPLIFGYVVAETLPLCGVRGAKAVEKAVRRYGARRGRRMAQKARQNGYDNDILGYLLFGEFDLSEVGNAYAIAGRDPDLEVHMTQCFWHGLWKEHGLLDYGRLYCRDIDMSLLEGFNDRLCFDAYDRFTTNRDICRFVYHGWPLTDAMLIAFMEKSKEVAPIAHKSWLYHTADLYQALSQAIAADCGSAGNEGLEQGLRRFSGQFGQEAAEQLLATVRETDFNAP